MKYQKIYDIFVAVLFILVILLFITIAVIQIRSDKALLSSKATKYKVKELEKGTVFIINDEIGYIAGDSIWVNMSTLKVDTKDSVAMMCVVVSKLPFSIK